MKAAAMPTFSRSTGFTLVLLALALPAGSLQAQQVYRCTDASGKVQLSDRACDASAVDAARVRLQPNVVDGSQGREVEQRMENQRLRQQLELERTQRAAEAAARPSTTSPECRQATITFNRTGKAQDRTLANAACLGADNAATIDAARARDQRRRATVTNCHNAGFGNVQCISN